MGMAEVKTELEIEKMRIEVDKLRAEIRKLDREYGVVPMAVGASIAIAATGLAALVLKLLKLIA